MSAPVVLVAAGGLAREALAALRRAEPGRPVLGFLDDDPARAGAEIAGLPVLGAVDAASGLGEAAFVICAGRGSARRAIAERLRSAGVPDEAFASVIDPSAVVADGCTVGAGSILLAHTVLTADAEIGRHAVCMPAVTITHDDRLDAFVTLAAGVSLGGGVRVGEAAYLGMHASVRQGVSIGAGATIGTGAVVLSDVPDEQTWVGVPARRLEGAE